jgi:ribosomal protein S19E (S16A)
MTAIEKKKLRTEIKVLELVAAGSRTPALLKKALRKDARAVVKLLEKDGSLEKSAEGDLILTKRGAGRLRFLPTALAS